MSYLYYRRFLEKLQDTLQPATFDYVFLSTARKASRSWSWLTTDRADAKDYFTVMEDVGRISQSLVAEGTVRIVDRKGKIRWDEVETELAAMGTTLEEFDPDCIPDVVDVMKAWCRKNPEPG